MNVRKLIGFGKNSYVISIPKDWLEKNKLKKGDLLRIDETQEGLILGLNNQPKPIEQKKITIESDKKSLDMIKTEIVSAYLDNYNIIEVMSKDLKTNSQEIKNMLNNLAGLEIIDQSSTKIVAKDLINISEISIPILIRRMDNITRAMMEDLCPCFEGERDVQDIVHRDEEVNRIHFLAERIIRSGLKDLRIAKSLDSDPLKLHSQHNVSVQIEKIADNLKLICKEICHLKMDREVRDKLKVTFENIKEGYKKVMTSFYTNDRKLALEIELTYRKWIQECDDFLDNHRHKGLDYNNAIKKGVCKFRPSCSSSTKVIDNMEGIISSIKYIARTIIGGG